MPNADKVIVVGAGIVGVQLARALQRDGFIVTLIDKQEPGTGTSFGNAGLIATDEIFPLAHGRILKALPRLLLDPTGPFSINWRELPKVLPWFMRFAAACSGTRAQRGIKALASLQSHAAESWREVTKQEQLSDLMRSNGVYKIFESVAGYAETKLEREAQSQHGITWEERSAEDLHTELPELTHTIHRGIFYPEIMHTVSPYELTQRILNRFIADGGTLKQGEVTRLISSDSNITGVECNGAHLMADRVVVTAGYLSAQLLRPLGYRAPMVAERGYHIEVSHEEISFSSPAGFHERGFYITPMKSGLRLAGTSEITSAHGDPPPKWQRAEILRRHVDDLLPGVAIEETHRWMGRRPTLSDFLPVLGAAPGRQNLFLAFGHHHLGLTLSAVTAQLMSDMMSERPARIDLGPFDLGRFG